MTVALGILAQGSMIVAADTELTVPDFMKTECGKINATVQAPAKGIEKGTIVVTGAGDAGYLEAIWPELRDEFLGHPSDTIPEIGKRFRGTLKTFYREHVVPFAQCADRPDIWLIVGVRRGPSRGMWRSDKNTLRPVTKFSAVGMGETHARHLFNLLDKPMEPETAIAVAAYLIYRIKQVVPGVGKSTHILCVGEPVMPTGVSEAQIEELEKIFRFYDGLEGQLVHWVLGSEYPFAEAPRIHKLIDHARGEIRKLLYPNRPTDVDISQA